MTAPKIVEPVAAIAEEAHRLREMLQVNGLEQTITHLRQAVYLEADYRATRLQAAHEARRLVKIADMMLLLIEGARGL